MELLHFKLLILIAICVPPILSQVHNDNICPDTKCSQYNCEPPACQCASFEPPGGMNVQTTPQFILFTFNKMVTWKFYDAFTKIFTKNRRNPTGMRITSTLFVSDKNGNSFSETTDYCLAQRLFEAGHELGSNTVTHRAPKDFWRSEAMVKDWTEELEGQRANLTKESKLPLAHVSGARAPWLLAGGDLQFRAEFLSKGFKFDSSLVLQSSTGQTYWPFTLDFNEGLACEGSTGSCPRNCYPKLWEVPMQLIDGPRGTKCTSLDFCVLDGTEEAIYGTLMGNYHRRRNGNRAPLVISINNEWFERNEDAGAGLARFVDRILEEDDTFIVSISQMLAWMKKPLPIDNMNEMVELYNTNKRVEQFCNTKRPSGDQKTFFMSGYTMLAIELIVLTVSLLYLIARDKE